MIKYIITLAILYLTSAAHAQETDVQLSSFFLKPQNIDLYSKTQKLLSESDKWKIKLYGLRMAALHPSEWAVLKADKTEGRRLVAIKPYYLRISENADFKIEELTIKFSFKKVSKKIEAVRYQEKDSVLDIGFGGKYEEGLPLSRPKKDDSYVLRLTAFSNFKSGLYYRSYGKHVLISEASQKSLKTDKQYELKIQFSKDEAKSWLNGNEFSVLKRDNINSGLIYLTTSWNPLKISNLQIKCNFKGKPLIISGLYKPKKRGKKK